VSHNAQILYVNVSASEARRRLEGHGFGVRRVENAGKNRAAILHTATGRHLRQLESLFYDALETRSDVPSTSDPQKHVPGDPPPVA
jgi:hypothetical protein